MFGCTAEEILGQSVSRLMPERFRAAHQAGLQRALTSKQFKVVGQTVELVGLRKDNSEFPVELSLGAWTTAEGAFFTGICRDITERKRAEAALRQSEASLQLAQRIGGIGGWELNLTTEALAWSAETYRIFGQSPAAFTPGRESFYTVVHPDDRARLRAAVAAAVQEGHSFSADHRILLPNGTERIVHEQAEVVVEAPTCVIKLAGTVQDITERRQSEAERERLIGELQEALANIKTLSGIIPICAGCKKIRDDQGYWSQVESYVAKHSLAKFSHGFCPDCLKQFYPEYAEDGK
jgi:PAS domain S-box-containing protein